MVQHVMYIVTVPSKLCFYIYNFINLLNFLFAFFMIMRSVVPYSNIITQPKINKFV
jgi:hypothetical protein